MTAITAKQGDGLPTFNCFDDATEFINVPPLDIPQSQLLLVHAIIRSPNGVRYAHAWVEQDDRASVRLAWQAAVIGGTRGYYALPVSVIFEIWNVRYSRRYTFIEAAEQEGIHNCAPPWDPYIRKQAERAKSEYVDRVNVGDRIVRTIGW